MRTTLSAETAGERQGERNTSVVPSHALYICLYSACEGKAMRFISVRLASAVSADKVVLIEDGVVGEYGSHEELMRRGGRYAEMFRAQAESYTGAQSTEE